MTTARFNIEGRDKTAKAFNSVKGRLDRLDRSVSKLSRGFGALAGGAVVAGIGAIAKKSIDAADAIQKLGVRTGASSEFLSEMRVAISQADVSSTEFANSLTKLNKSAQDASDGLSTPARAFEKLGISVQEFNNLNTDQKFTAVAEAVSKIQDPAIKTQVAMDLMGRSGSQLLTVMEGGAAGLDEYRNKAVELGQSLSQEMVDGAAEANDALDLLGKSISGSISQTILTYTDEIKAAADLTREYLPKAIGFLIDMFKGLKAVIEFVVSFVINRLGDFLSFLSKIPGVGKYFDGMRDSVKLMGEVMDDQFESTVGSMGKWRDGAQKTEGAAKDLGGEIKKGAGVLVDFGEASDEATSSVKSLSDLMPGFNDRIKAANDVFNEASDILDELVRKHNEFDDALSTVKGEIEQTKRNQEKFNKMLATGTLTAEEAAAMASKLGLEYEGLGEKTSIVSDAWEDANRKIFDSMQTFFRDGLDGWDNFGDSVKDIVKDMIASILAQITQLLVSNAFKKMISFLTNGKKFGGTGLFDGLGSLFGGSPSTSPSGEESPISSDGVGDVATVGGTIAKTLGGVGTSIKAGATAAWGSIKAAGSALLAGAKSLISAIPGWGWAIAGIAAAYKIFGGGRSPQELGEDQLQAVSDATKAGRNTQVQLGSVGGVATSFLGGFDENSTFFGVDLLKDELQKVGDVLKTKFGFDQALALKDGVIRLEDFSREFSANNEEIVAEVQASILIAKHAFDDAELAKVKSLGKSVIAMDRLYDQSADSGKSAADRLKEAYMGAFGASEDAATTALANMGLETERLAQIFDTSSNEILATLTGVATDGLGLFGQSISEMGTQADATFNQIEQRINGVSVAAQNSAGQVVNAYDGAYDRVQSRDDAFSRRLLQKLDQITDNSSVTRGNSQPLAGI